MKRATGFIVVGVILMFCSCFWPHYMVEYDDLRLPSWTEPEGRWSFDDELWLMDSKFTRGRYMEKYEKRDASIVNKYYINGALCRAYMKAKERGGYSSRNPYRLYLDLYGRKGVHTSVTIKSMKIYQQGGNDLSDLINDKLPVTILFGGRGWDFRSLYHDLFETEAIFNFKQKPVFIEVNMEVQSTENTATGTLFFELTPKVKAGLFIDPFEGM